MDKKQLFLNYLKKELPERYDSISSALNSRPKISFRVNHILDPDEDSINTLQTSGAKISKHVPTNSYLLENDFALSRSQEFEDGKIYIQSLSSMMPARALAPAPGERVLDMCASPGSKTSQMANLMNNLGEIIALENNKARVYKLEQNIKKLGVKNVKVLNIDARFFLKTFPQFNDYFDKVLVDAPCSNEGNICFCDDTVERWNPKLAKKISKLQKHLLLVGARSLKPGGTIVYSTCTYNRVENEDVVSWVLKKNNSLKLKEEHRTYYDGLYTGFYFAIIARI